MYLGTKANGVARNPRLQTRRASKPPAPQLLRASVCIIPRRPAPADDKRVVAVRHPQPKQALRADPRIRLLHRFEVLVYKPPARSNRLVNRRKPAGRITLALV